MGGVERNVSFQESSLEKRSCVRGFFSQVASYSSVVNLNRKVHFSQQLGATVFRNKRFIDFGGKS